MRNLKDLVKNKTARFSYYRDRALHYEVVGDGFIFPVPVEDAGSATFNAEEKAILLMRYIRKHLESTEKERKKQAERNAQARKEERRHG